jgi:putative hemolysin
MIEQMFYLIEILIILVLIILNGLFALSEFAIVSARKSRLQQRADEGDARAAAALELANEPISFLSTIQIGITLIGILAGAYGGATLAGQLAPSFAAFPVLAPYAEALSITLIVLVITYLTLIFGELVPKRIALNNPEAIASIVARPMRFLSIAAAPLVFILSRSTEVALRILRVQGAEEPPVTEEEIRIMLKEGTETGIFEKAEVSMVEGVFNLGDRRAEAMMTRRPDIVGLDLDEPATENIKKMTASGHSDFPAFEGGLDSIRGFVSVKKVLAQYVDGRIPDIRTLVTPPFIVPESITVLQLLEAFRERGVRIALVTDEYGSINGLVTLHDILESIVGDLREYGEPDRKPVVVREDGSWLIDGSTPVDDLRDVLSVDIFHGEEDGGYRTIAGLVLYALGRIPATGDHVELDGLRYEVADMDGNRVDKVLVTRIPAQTSR